MRLSVLSDDLADLIAKVMPGVVGLFGTAADLSEASGSGFVADKDGHIVTNFHVVDGLNGRFNAHLSGGVTAIATLVGSDPLTDLAVLKLDEPAPCNLTFREKPARLGELCCGLGSPFGMYPESAGLGVVSGLARSIPVKDRRPIEHAIQTDVAMNPGNSGGPLIDMTGRVIGVNQCVDARAQGIGFAIPADTTRYVLDELLRYGDVQRAAIGVAVAPRPVALGGRSTIRLAVVSTRADSPLTEGDFLLTVAGHPVRDRGDLFRVLTRDRIEKAVEFTVLRNGREAHLEVTPKRLGAAAVTER